MEEMTVSRRDTLVSVVWSRVLRPLSRKASIMFQISTRWTETQDTRAVNVLKVPRVVTQSLHSRQAQPAMREAGCAGDIVGPPEEHQAVLALTMLHSY